MYDDLADIAPPANDALANQTIRFAKILTGNLIPGPVDSDAAKPAPVFASHAGAAHQARALVSLAETAQSLGRPAHAAAILRKAVGLARQVLNLEEKANLLTAIATVYASLGHMDRAYKMFEEAILVAYPVSGNNIIVESLVRIAQAALSLKDPDQVIKILKKMNFASRAVDKADQKIRLLVAAAKAAPSISDTSKAGNHLELIIDELNDEGGLEESDPHLTKAKVWLAVAKAQISLNRILGASQLLEFVVGAVKPHEFSHEKSELLKQAIQMAMSLNNVGLATKIVREAEKVADEKITDPYDATEIKTLIAKSYEVLERDEAVEAVKEAEALAKTSGERAAQLDDSSPEKNEKLLVVARAFGTLGKVEQANEHIRDAVPPIGSLENASMKIKAWIAVAEAYISVNNMVDAAEILKGALTEANNVEDQDEKVKFVQEIVSLALSLNNADLTTSVLEKASGVTPQVQSLAVVVSAYDSLGINTKVDEILEQMLTTARETTSALDKGSALAVVAKTHLHLKRIKQGVALSREARDAISALSDDVAGKRRVQSEIADVLTVQARSLAPRQKSSRKSETTDVRLPVIPPSFAQQILGTISEAGEFTQPVPDLLKWLHSRLMSHMVPIILLALFLFSAMTVFLGFGAVPGANETLMSAGFFFFIPWYKRSKASDLYDLFPEADAIGLDQLGQQLVLSQGKRGGLNMVEIRSEEELAGVAGLLSHTAARESFLFVAKTKAIEAELRNRLAGYLGHRAGVVRSGGPINFARLLGQSLSEKGDLAHLAAQFKANLMDIRVFSSTTDWTSSSYIYIDGVAVDIEDVPIHVYVTNLILGFVRDVGPMKDVTQFIETIRNAALAAQQSA